MTLSAQDMLELHHLYAVYSHAVDDGDGAGVAACFVPDGVLDTGQGLVEGSDALVAFGVNTAAAVPGIRHLVTNVHVTGDGSQATGRAYIYSYRPTESGPEAIFTGRYRDDFARVDEEWLLVKRQFVADAI